MIIIFILILTFEMLSLGVWLFEIVNWYIYLWKCYFVCFLTFMVFCNCKLISFFVKSLSHQNSKDDIQGRRLNLILQFSYYMSFGSSLQFHPLWVTLYVKHVISLNSKKDSEFLTPVFKIKRTGELLRFLGCNVLYK